MKKHQKHTAIKKPHGGLYHTNEFGIIGAPCPLIKDIISKINKALSEDYLIGHMDADHHADESDTGYQWHYVDKIDYHNIAYKEDYADYSLSQSAVSADLLLINGNHFKADKQIVIINDKKKESLSRKVNRLTDVIAFVLDHGQDAPHEFLKDAVDGFDDVPIISVTDVSALIEIIRVEMTKRIPALHGLLLYGGKSQRMGTDKGMIDYHGLPQVDYLRGVLDVYCEEVYVSKLKSSENDEYKVIEDTFTGLGPYGGILSAFRHDPNKAYLTVPCDVPFVDKDVIGELVRHRDPSKMATCFHNDETGFPEPLITIWEPRSYARLLHFLSRGYSCPRKVLINSEIKEITPVSNNILFNANTVVEAELAKNMLQKAK